MATIYPFPAPSHGNDVTHYLKLDPSGVPSDFEETFPGFVMIDNMMSHKRWVNPDGSRKKGRELEREELKVAIEVLTQRLLAYMRENP